MFGGSLPVQQLPVLSTPAVLEFLCVHATNLIKIWLVDSKQTKAIYLPVSWEKRPKTFQSPVPLLPVASTDIKGPGVSDCDATAFNRARVSWKQKSGL